jgi:chemosensory pili system protein ChpA (sensor histidine kinase/response regulator)
MALPCIAVVDDDPNLLALVAMVLTMGGYDSAQFRTSTDASSGMPDLQPDLAIVDLNLERRGAGLEVIAALRNDPATAHLPIIVWSSDGEVATIVARRNLDGVVVRVKPVLPDELLRLITDLLPAN